MSLPRPELQYEKIARICRGPDPIPTLVKLLDDPATTMPDKVQEAILYLLEGKHEWRQIVQLGIKWKKMSWLSAFIGRMRNRAHENEKHIIKSEDYERQLERLINKVSKEDVGRRQPTNQAVKIEEKKHEPETIHRSSRKVLLQLHPVKLDKFTPIKPNQNPDKLSSAKMDQAIRNKAFQFDGKVNALPASSPIGTNGNDAEFSFDKKEKIKKPQKAANIDTNNLFNFIDLQDLQKENELLRKQQQEQMRKQQEKQNKKRKIFVQQFKVQAQVLPPPPAPFYPPPKYDPDGFGHTPNTLRRKKRKSKKTEQSQDQKPIAYEELFKKKMAERGLQFNQKGNIVDYRRQHKILNFTKEQIENYIKGGDKSDEKIMKKIESEAGINKIVDNVLKSLNGAINADLNKTKQLKKPTPNQHKKPTLTKQAKIVSIKNGKRVVQRYDYYDSSFIDSSQSQESDVQFPILISQSNALKASNPPSKSKGIQIQGISQRHDARFQQNFKK